jgi:hypothetical protein
MLSIASTTNLRDFSPDSSFFPSHAGQRPLSALNIEDGVSSPENLDFYAASGGTITCPEGTVPTISTTNGGRTVVVVCKEPPVEDEKLNDW